MSTVTRYEHLARAIAEAYPALPNRLQGIARFALDNPDQMALSTVAEIARAAGVPPSAVIRFANALGFDGFLALQRVYRERLVARSATYRERIESLRKRGGGGMSVLAQLADSAIEELEQLREHVEPGLFHRAATLILGASRVHVVAQYSRHPRRLLRSRLLQRPLSRRGPSIRLQRSANHVNGSEKKLLSILRIIRRSG